MQILERTILFHRPLVPRFLAVQPTTSQMIISRCIGALLTRVNTEQQRFLLDMVLSENDGQTKPQLEWLIATALSEVSTRSTVNKSMFTCSFDEAAAPSLCTALGDVCNKCLEKKSPVARQALVQNSCSSKSVQRSAASDDVRTCSRTMHLGSSAVLDAPIYHSFAQVCAVSAKKLSVGYLRIPLWVGRNLHKRGENTLLAINELQYPKPVWWMGLHACKEAFWIIMVSKATDTREVDNIPISFHGRMRRGSPRWPRWFRETNTRHTVGFRHAGLGTPTHYVTGRLNTPVVCVAVSIACAFGWTWASSQRRDATVWPCWGWELPLWTAASCKIHDAFEYDNSPINLILIWKDYITSLVKHVLNEKTLSKAS